MHLQRLVPLAIAGLLLGACSGSSNSPRATPQPPATNGNGTFVSGIMTARFDPTAVSTPPSNAAPAGVGLAPTPALSVSTVTGFSLPTLPPAPPPTTSSAAPSGTVAAPRERAGAAR